MPRKRPPAGGLFLTRESALGKLLAATGLVQTDLLSFHLAGITRNQTRGFECRLEIPVIFDQGAGNPVTYGTRLSGFTPPPQR